MPHASAPGARRTGRINPDNDAHERRRAGNARRLDKRARPQCIDALLDDLAIDLLPAKPRSRIAGEHFVKKCRRQVRGIGVRRGPRDGGARIGDQALDQRDRPRCRGDELARALPQAQAELQHVERCIDVTPFGELVTPRGIELRPAQLFGIFSGKSEADRPARPFQPPARSGPFRAFATRRDLQETRGALDHHLAYVVLGFANERDLQRSPLGIRADAVRHRPHPFGAQSCLAGATATEHQPGRPMIAAVRTLWRFLMRVRERDEVTRQA